MQQKATLLLVFCLYTSFTFSQTQTPVYLSQSISNANSKGFYQYLPAGYSTNSKNYPLIIWLHGAGQIGQGNVIDLPKVLEWGVPKIINEGGFPASFTVGDSSFSFIIISPQFMGWPSSTNVAGIITYAMSNYRVDLSRIYLMGISAGGGGVWNYASASKANSDKLAAIIPFCGTTAPTQALANNIASSQLPVWAFHNTNDGTVPVANSRNWKNYINAFVPAPNPLAKLTEFPVVSNNAVIAHECWSLATLPTYKPNGINIYEWMLGYRKRTVTVNRLPIASAGQDQGIVLPTNALLDGSASTDQDGVIVSYRWRKIIGPSNYLFSDSTLIKPTVSNLSQGVYQFELTVTDNLAAVSKDTVVVNVYAALPLGAQQMVLIDVGPANASGGTITTSPSLNGNVWNNMTDARPGIRVSNAKTTANISTTIGLEVINRIDGTYNTSANGMNSISTIGTVGIYPSSATNDYAFAHNSTTNGKWRINGLEADKSYVIKFWGSKSGETLYRDIDIKRSDETVWKSYSGGSNTNFNTAAFFNIIGKTEVDFDIRAKSTSTFGYINVIDITWNSTAPNLSPIANAGADLNITLPVDSVTINGCTSSDPENAPLKYKWRKISGPSNFLISTDTLCTIKVNSLVAGTYSFELLVSDTGGLNHKDTVSIVVNSFLPIVSWPVLPAAICPQPYKVVMLGSSTTYGTGASPIDSSWVNKFRSYVQQRNAEVTVTNLGLGGFTSYHISPTSFIPPANRPFPDTTRNITAALALNPDAIIINLPTNDAASSYSFPETQDNFNRIITEATTRNIPVWVTTSQPRNGLSAGQVNNLIQFKDWVNQQFGNKAIDFWSTVANTNGTINATYDYGDGVHLNNYGHHILFSRVLYEKIWDSICIRKNIPANIAPIANAGPDASITLPTNVVSISGAASTDADGIIVSYSWRNINIVAGVNIANNSSVQTNINFTNAGQYQFELTVTDNNGATSKDTVLITVNTSVNIPPVANAGADQSITLPNNIVSLNGSLSIDSDGSIVGYKWRKFSGAVGVSISDSSASITNVSFVTAGSFQFELTVTDNNGATAKDTVLITVNASANIPPVANAGTDQSTTLPSNIVSLNGSLSIDSDGSIVGYKWRKFSGAVGVSISDSSASITNVSFVTAGSYQFELTITDNLGSSSKDTLVITVYPVPVNLNPVANAGSDKNIQLPNNRGLLDGRNSFDPEGALITFVWSLISGPSGSQLLTSLKDTTSVTFINSGTYIFRLTVTDGNGLNGTDDVTINVLAPSVVNKKIKVNIYGGSNPYTNPQWNNWNLNAGGNSNKFLYDDLSLSNVNATTTSAGLIRDNGLNYASSSTACPAEVLRYNAYNTSFTTLTINGLNSIKKYNFEFYASRINSPGNSTVFKIGNSLDTISVNDNINDYAKFYNISPDNNGRVTITISRIGTWHYFAGFVISEQEVSQPLISFRGTEIMNSLYEEEYFSVPTITESSSIIIYPNPAKENLKLIFIEKFTGKYSLALLDVNGKTVLQKTGIKYAGSNSTALDIKALKKGIYILQFTTQDKKSTSKIIKL